MLTRSPCALRHLLVATRPAGPASRSASRLTYHGYGPAHEVICINHFPDPDAPHGRHNVIVRMQLSPINPADLNTIQGTYPIKHALPAVGGGEGVGVVEMVGADVKGLKKGDWVVPTENMAGTWSTYLETVENNLIKVRNDIPLEVAATIRINPGTAYQMLHGFITMSPGDVVIQNGANSAAGQSVIQIAKKMGLVSVNIVRDRENIDALKSELKELGANHVWTEEELRKAQDFRECKIPKPRLALNCVGGSSATEIAKTLAAGGVHVTYGGMSLKPVTVSTSALIFHDISVRGFWFSRWMDANADNPAEKEGMFEVLGQMAKNGELVAPKHEIIPLQDFHRALEQANKGFKNYKFILDLR